jgi:hypothetical protein
MTDLITSALESGRAKITIDDGKANAPSIVRLGR